MNIQNNIIKVLNKLLLSTVIAMTINTVNASVKIKLFGGGTNTSQRFEADRFGYDPLSIGADPNDARDYTQYKKTTSSNLLTPGVGMVVDKIIDLSSAVNKSNLGLELDVYRQLEGYKFDNDTDAGESAFVGLATSDLMKIKVSNEYKVNLNALLTVADRFYVKLGPSVIRQKIQSEVYTSGRPKAISSLTNTDREYAYGINLGSGLSYEITKGVSIFSELNYSYYIRKNLSDFNFNPAVIDPATSKANPVSNYNRQFRLSQIDYLLGVAFALA